MISKKRKKKKSKKSNRKNKRSSSNIFRFFRSKLGDLQNKKKKKVFRLHMLISQCHFNGPPLELMSSLLGLLKPTAFQKLLSPFMGPLKSMVPRVIVHPAPLSESLLRTPPLTLLNEAFQELVNLHHNSNNTRPIF